MEDQGQYKFDKTEFTGATSQLTEVEKAQAPVNEWEMTSKKHTESVILNSVWHKGEKLVCISGYMENKIVTFESQSGDKIKIQEHPGMFKKTDFRPLPTADI